MRPQQQRLRSVSHLVLSASLLIVVPLAGARPLRVPGVHQVVGLLVFSGLLFCAWALSRPTSAPISDTSLLARVAGSLFLAPFALVALLWVGLGTPWDSSTIENRMRYAVLVVASVAVTAAFVVAKEALSRPSNRLLPSLALASGTLSGAGYLVWSSFYLGAFASQVSSGSLAPGVHPVMNILDVLLFVSSALAYCATAALAYSLRKVDWLGPGPARAFAVLSAVAFTFLMLRGLSFPSPGQSPLPWFARPGFIVGIPAVPWVMP